MNTKHKENMKQLEAYKIGSKFPRANYDLKIDGGRLIVDENSIGFFVGMAALRKEEIQAAKRRLTYALFIEDDIPFFLIRSDAFLLEFNCNIKLLPEDSREQFLSGIGNLASFFLVDSDTFVIKNIRAFSIEKRILDTFLRVVNRQEKRYDSAVEVSEARERIERKYTIEKMFSSTQIKHTLK